MYSTYSSDQEFQRMFAKKKQEKQLLFPGSRKPDQETVKKMIKYLNKNPGEVSKIRALKKVCIKTTYRTINLNKEFLDPRGVRLMRRRERKQMIPTCRLLCNNLTL